MEDWGSGSCLCCGEWARDGEQTVRWIPIEEGLPEEAGSYLVVTNFYYGPSVSIVGFSTNRHGICDFDLKDLGAGFYGYDTDYGYYPVDDVLYWMPIPRLPEGVGKSE